MNKEAIFKAITNIYKDTDMSVLVLQTGKSKWQGDIGKRGDWRIFTDSSQRMLLEKMFTYARQSQKLTELEERIEELESDYIK